MTKSHILAISFIVFATCLMFFKIFTRGLYPIPGDLLVSFYFPWYSGGWEGYNPWTTRKELLAADSVRQIYPWKEYASDQFKKGQFPLWNPYTFSGQPLSANFQSSVYYPLNFFYFLTDARNAWLFLVIAQPLLGGIFMYLAIRSFKISALGGTFAAVAFMFSSYLVTWLENANVAHSYIWLPLTFWAINRYFATDKFRYLLVLITCFSLSILAGHPQTAIYIYLTSALFFFYKIRETKSQFFAKTTKLFLVVTVSFLLSAIQLLPTLTFYKQSPISLPFARDVFDRSILPPKNLITFFASDFYGNPATNNFWSQHYGDFTPYFGVVPLIFAVWATFRLWQNKFVKFATITSALFILSAVQGPITFLIKTLKIPLLDATSPARFISVAIFLMIILSAFGIEDLVKNFQAKKYLNQFLKFLIPFAAVYIVLWLFAILGDSYLNEGTWEARLAVTRRNLILPTAMFASIPIGALITSLIRKKFKLSDRLAKSLFLAGIFTILLVGGVYYTNKFLPVAPKKFIFPDHLIFEWIQQNAGLNRFYGGGTAHIDYNFPTHYQVFGVEGYDSLRFKRYAELLASSYTGEIPSSYLRSDAVLPETENGYRRRLFELLAVKYLLDKEDNPKTGADWHYERFPKDQVTGFWQDGKFQVYTREPVLPRAFLTTKYLVAQNDQEIIEKIYDPNFNLQTLILEEKPPIEIQDSLNEIVLPQLIKYQPNEVTFTTSLDANSLLFLSDVYDSDWHVTIDRQETKLLRANFALRSVAVPAGSHTVTFKYQPKSFYLGAAVSLVSLIIILSLSLDRIKQKKF